MLRACLGLCGGMFSPSYRFVELEAFAIGTIALPKAYNNTSPNAHWLKAVNLQKYLGHQGGVLNLNPPTTGLRPTFQDKRGRKAIRIVPTRWRGEPRKNTASNQFYAQVLRAIRCWKMPSGGGATERKSRQKLKSPS